MRILIAGDFCPQLRVEELFKKDDYAAVLSSVRDLTKVMDYSIVNLECPVIKGNEKPLDKVGPHLHCSEKGISAVKWAGFNCVTLANNHFYDFGDDGVRHTLECCRNYGIETVGGGMVLEEADRILYKQFSDYSLAIINCCEHEFSIATEASGGSNPLNPIHQFYSIKVAKERADYVLIIVHGGNENYQLPSPRMKEVYRFFIDSGADAVINHHQHCFSGFEVYKNKPIFYGLGNFCFDNNKSGSPWNEGYMVELDFDKCTTFRIVPYIQCGDSPQIVLTNRDDATFKDVLLKINQIILDPLVLEEHYREYIESKDIAHVFEPYTNPCLISLRRRNLLPSFISKKKKRELLAYIQCESHIVKVLHYLKKR